MIRGRIFVSSKHPEILAKSLAPDNLPNMKVKSGKDGIFFSIHARKIGSLIASMDDFLLNLKIAEDVSDLCKS
jgi:tRNA threonylcarbamoyladenosine modification (KEOPS) complex  Pcc1 subunit